MALSDRRELQPAVEYGGAETEVTYQDNVKFTFGGLGLDLSADEGLAVATASEGYGEDGGVDAEVIAIRVQVRDMNVYLAERTLLRAYLSTDPDGASAVTALQATAAEATVVGTEVAEYTDLADHDYLTDEHGRLILELETDQIQPLYLAVIYKGRLFVSPLLPWA